MLDGRRKSIEPMAARLGEVHYQALHHFVATSPWDWRLVRRRLADRLVAALAPTAWVVDDTGFPKDGPCYRICRRRPPWPRHRQTSSRRPAGYPSAGTPGQGDQSSSMARF
jgi:hypothetical protein